jgi:hypothetical protein
MATAELETEAPQAVRCWIEDRRVCVELIDERTVSFPAAKFPRLAKASTLYSTWRSVIESFRR